MDYKSSRLLTAVWTTPHDLLKRQPYFSRLPDLLKAALWQMNTSSLQNLILGIGLSPRTSQGWGWYLNQSTEAWRSTRWCIQRSWPVSEEGGVRVPILELRWGQTLHIQNFFHHINVHVPRKAQLVYYVHINLRYRAMKTMIFPGSGPTLPTVAWARSKPDPKGESPGITPLAACLEVPRRCGWLAVSALHHRLPLCHGEEVGILTVEMIG